MASKSDGDYEFVHELPQDFICGICLSVLQQPQMVNCCEKYFCEDCLLTWKKKKVSCPNCRNTDFSHMTLHTLPRKIAVLEVFCPNRQHGCKKMLAMRDCDHHLSPDNIDGCNYVKLPCPNACGEQNIFRADLYRHSKDCPKRPVTCPHCGESGGYQEMRNDHPHQCLLYPLPCPLYCGVTVARQDMPTHQHSCLLEPVSCPFSEVGCKANILRKDLDRHLKSAMITHLTQLTTAHVSLKDDHITLKKDHTSLRQDHMTLNKDYTSLKEDHTTLKAEYKELQEKNRAVEIKLSDVGLVMDGLHTLLGQPTTVSSKLRQLDTVLVDTSVKTIGSSIPLELSRRTGRGSHYILVDGLKFQLEWSYNLGKLQTLLYLIQSQNSPTLPHDWSCDFIIKIEPHQVAVKTKLHGIATSTTASSISNFHILAVICCGEFQTSTDDKSSNTKKLVGPTKTIPINSDVTLALLLKQHEHVLMSEFSTSQRRMTLGTSPSSLAHMFTCRCPCHVRKMSLSCSGTRPTVRRPNTTITKN